MKLSPKPRQNAITILNWFQENVDFSILEQQGNMEIYHSAMKWFEENLANSKYVQLEDEDIECLLALRHNAKNLEELSNITAYNIASLRSRMYKLVSRGLVISYKEKKSANIQNKVTYYKLSPFGHKQLFNLIQN